MAALGLVDAVYSARLPTSRARSPPAFAAARNAAAVLSWSSISGPSAMTTILSPRTGDVSTRRAQRSTRGSTETRRQTRNRAFGRPEARWQYVIARRWLSQDRSRARHGRAVA